MGAEFIKIDPLGWLSQMYALVNHFNLFEAIEQLAWAIIFAAFAYGGIKAAMAGKSSEMSALVTRLLFTGAVMLLIPEIRTLAHEGWLNVYQFTAQVWTQNSNPLVTLQEVTENLDYNLGSLFAGNVILQQAGSSNFHDDVRSLWSNNPITAMIPLLGTMLMMLVIPFILMMYGVLIFGSGTVVMIAVALLPLCAATLMIPGGAFSLMTNWIKMYVGAIFTVAFLPVMFGLVLILGFVEPMKHLASELEVMNTQLEQSFAQRRASALDPVEYLAAQFGNLIEQTFRSLLLVGMGAVSMVVGFFIGILLLFRIEKYVGDFLGGSLGGIGSAGAAAAGALAMGAIPRGRSAGSSSGSSQKEAGGSGTSDLQTGGSPKSRVDSGNVNNDWDQPAYSNSWGDEGSGASGGAGRTSNFAREDNAHMYGGPTVETSARRVN